MSISIFTIKGHNQSFYNLDKAIHAAKDIVKNAIITYVMTSKEITEEFNPENKTFSNENLRKCKLKYSVTQNAHNEVRVRAKLAIPVKYAGDIRTHDTTTRSVIISASQMDYWAMQDIEEVFAELEDETTAENTLLH